MGSGALRPALRSRRTRSVPAALVVCLAGTVIAQQPGPPGNVRILREHAAVSNVVVSSITTSGATISWTTAASSSSQVEFGTAPTLGTTTSVNNTAVTSHTVTLSGLASGTLYYFRVLSRDAAGNLWTSLPQTFTTLLPPDTTTVTLFPQDTTLNLNTTNYSADQTLHTYTWPANRVANAILMKVNLSSLPQGAVIQSATLNLTLVESDTAAEPTYAIAAHKIEGRNPVITGATGYTFDGVTGWTANACCSNNVPMAQADISPAYDTRAVDKTPGVKSWTLTAMVQEWADDPATNFGLLLNSDTSKGADRYRYFASMEHTDPALRPVLRVAYTVPPPDTTLPSVTMTAPASGSTVSGTVTVSANATDNVRVASVQFQLDGADLSPRDTSSPFSISWNTTTAAAGSHTLRAIARDAAGNTRTSAGVTVTVSNQTGSAGIATLYPGDIGIENHPDVVFTEMFEQSSISTMTSRYTSVGHSAGMAFSTSKPAGSPGSRSLQMGTDPVNPASTLYKTFPNDQQWYLRYYVNYNSTVEYGHTSAWLGGYNPLLSFPNPQAGSKPAGNDRFSTGVEPLSFDNDRWMPYTYWKDMRQAGDGKYWGNVFLPSDTSLRMARNRWYCVETMVKLNNPVTDSNGELAVWIDGQKIIHLGKGFPNGSWSGGTFTQNASGSPFGGFQWRSDSALNLNWIWLQNYVTSAPSTVQFDHVVLARNYIGCLSSDGAGDTTPPTVSISSPAAAATVLGTAVTVTANASDNGGVAGVQFKLNGINLGAEDTTAPYSVAWNTTLVGNGLQTLTAVARDTAGNTTTSPAVTVTVSNPVGGLLWPNEPSGFVQVNDQPWNLLTGNAWNYLRRAASKNADIVTDTSAPFSPLNVLRMIFTTDMGSDREPGVHWMSLPGLKEVYTAWWLKVSPNWNCSPAGCGKMTFLFATGGGNVYTTILNPDSGMGPPFRVGLRPQWGGYDFNLTPNVTTTLISPGEWRRIEFYYKYESSPGAGDGIIRWWVDGVLNGNYTNIRYPTEGFVEFQYAPTLQNAPPAEQYMYIDHTRVSRR
jgi:hypothetical protein